MKYVATVEIEFETADDPLEHLHHLMRKTHHIEVDRSIDGKWTRESSSGVEHYHIVEQPKELK